MRAMRQSMRSTPHSASLPRLSETRSRVAMLVLTMAFITLLGRAFYLQGPFSDFLQERGQARYARTLELPAVRGKIMDRNGVVLASSIPAKAVWAIPEDVEIRAKNFKELSQLLDIPEKEIRQRLQDEDRKFVYLKRQLAPEIAAKVSALQLNGIHIRDEYRRFYPEGEALAHVLGFTDIEDIGQEGIELAHDNVLKGQAGSRRVIKDRLGRVIEDVEGIRPALAGRDLVLSIDSKIQFLAFSELKAGVEANNAKAGAIVVLDARTGEVLAMANYPTYNPNQRRGLSGAQLRNRAITDTYEPGSTMKPFTIAVGLETGKITPETSIQTGNGKLQFGQHVISDTHANGLLTVNGVLQKSSNIGMTKISQMLAAKDMWQEFTQVGLGQAPRIGFPGAVAGRLRPAEKWRPIEQATMSYGYGLSVSLIQMARAYTVFVNDGQVLPLSFTKLQQPTQGVRVISPKTAEQMRKMLEYAAGPGGTAPRAQVVGYSVAGKTGTARKQSNGGYVERKYIGSFIGFAPASNPRLIVAVMVDEPSAGKIYGGDVAAPIFAGVVAGALRALNVAPDAPYKTLIVRDEGAPETIGQSLDEDTL
ncbi:MAG: penicillin-binding protein 2 [Burkholderiaceae bacterium]|nr:penicillin-binding protein 2 [Burkholderiaceae bacterium]